MKTLAASTLIIVVFALGTYHSSVIILAFGWLLYVVFNALLSTSKESRKLPKIDPYLYDSDRIVDQAHGSLEMDTATNHVCDVGTRITRAAGLSEHSFRFHVLNDSRIHGFAQCPRTIGITYGLYKDCRSEDELAAVLGHEIGHLVSATKHKYRLIKSKEEHHAPIHENDLRRDHSQLTRFCADPKATKLYERHRGEYEADRLSIKYLEKAGYDPDALGRLLWRHMSYAVKEGTTDLFDDSLTSHPTELKRILCANRVVAECSQERSNK